ncbi:hypothetical protein AVEN_253849-1 [Araneus ventricosus]|uniref:Uncharacterized protein n=1 Tax=Araneus ventricosus TaxID=182803 RepID=A0A4Y2TW34_ARAVE|nr:hypothetical protein AVEN_253849-1 [Araneus ventricosus]
MEYLCFRGRNGDLERLNHLVAFRDRKESDSGSETALNAFGRRNPHPEREEQFFLGRRGILLVSFHNAYPWASGAIRLMQPREEFRKMINFRNSITHLL